MNIKEVCEEIKNPLESFDIKKLIMSTAVPFEWCKGDKSHPIQQLGYYYFGIGDGFKFNEQKVNEADELLLWKLYALTQKYWKVHYEEWHERTTNMVFNMRNSIEIKDEDVGKDMLSVYEKYYDWKNKGLSK